MQDNRELREGVFFCRADNFLATKDYLENELCVRLLGVEPNEFSDTALEEGVTTFTIDLDHCELCKFDRWSENISRVCKNNHIPNEVEEFRDNWFRLEVEFSSYGPSYLYKTFSEDQPKYFVIRKLSVVNNGPTLLPVANEAKVDRPNPFRGCLRIDTSSDQNILASSLKFTISPSASNVQHINPIPFGRRFRFNSFHVGQGMCSLVTNGAEGYLLDVGAGKPIIRPDYIHNNFRNDLCKEVANLTPLQAVISHADSDHWRILSWDNNLLGRVSAIYFPSGSNSLILKDKAIKRKAYGLNDDVWLLDNISKLHFFRSDPHIRDSNGNCLVAIFESNGQKVLTSGDYVYERFNSDGNIAIRNLQNARFDAVVVPHHGDAASSKRIVQATGVAKAFFSAGTHKGYRHPTQASLDAHVSAHYNNIQNPANPDIECVNLL